MLTVAHLLHDDPQIASIRGCPVISGNVSDFLETAGDQAQPHTELQQLVEAAIRQQVALAQPQGHAEIWDHLRSPTTKAKKNNRFRKDQTRKPRMVNVLPLAWKATSSLRQGNMQDIANSPRNATLCQRARISTSGIGGIVRPLSVKDDARPTGIQHLY